MTHSRILFLPLIFLAAVSALTACASKAATARYEREEAWYGLPPEGKAKIVSQACDPDRQVSTEYTVTSCPSRAIRSLGGPTACTETKIRPPMTPYELVVDTRATVVATCRQLVDVASRHGATHQAWCSSDVPAMLPQGVTLDQAEAQAAACLASALRRLGDTTNQRRERCCADRVNIGSNGVWKCLHDETDKLDVQRADEACQAALGGPRPYGAALWCGVCADPEAFMKRLTEQQKESSNDE